MGSVIKRSALPTCLLLVGIASFVYGVTSRTLPVTQEVLETVEKQREVDREVTRRIPLPGFPQPLGLPDDLPPELQPPGQFQEYTEIVTESETYYEDVTRGVTTNESERVVVQETTMGGLELDSGNLKRTYNLVRTRDGKESTKGPPGCPT